MDLPPPLLAFVMMLPSDCEMWHLSDVASAGHVYMSVIMRTALGPFCLWARPFQNKMQVIDPIQVSLRGYRQLCSRHPSSCLIDTIIRKAILCFLHS